MHLETGYARTFERIVKGVLEALEFDGSPEASPSYESIGRFSVGDRGVGTQCIRFDRQQDGTTRVAIRSWGIGIGPDRSLRTFSHTGIEVSRSDGSLVRASDVATSNGETSRQLTLEPAEPGGWSLQGTIQTKPIQHRWVDDRVPLTLLGEYLAIRNAIASQGVGGRVENVTWNPGDDPTRLLGVTLEIRERMDGDLYRVDQTVAGVEQNLVLDASGAAVSIRVDRGGYESRSERIFQRGSF